jgi:hypothetical protein
LIPSENVLRFYAVTVEARKKAKRSFTGRMIQTAEVVMQRLAEQDYFLFWVGRKVAF